MGYRRERFERLQEIIGKDGKDIEQM